jgi:hypothetical protein
MERYFLPLKIARPEGSASRHKNDAMESQPMTEKELMIEELLAPPKPSLARYGLPSPSRLSCAREPRP